MSSARPNSADRRGSGEQLGLRDDDTVERHPAWRARGIEAAQAGDRHSARLRVDQRNGRSALEFDHDRENSGRSRVVNGRLLTREDHRPAAGAHGRCRRRRQPEATWLEQRQRHRRIARDQTLGPLGIGGLRDPGDARGVDQQRRRRMPSDLVGEQAQPRHTERVILVEPDSEPAELGEL